MREWYSTGFVVWSVNRLRFRRAPLAQPHRQRDDREHGEELALPVLHRLEPELWRRHVLGRRQLRRRSVLELFVVESRRARPPMQHERGEEEEEEREGQR